MTLPAALQARLKRRGIKVPEPPKEEPPLSALKKPNYKAQPLPPGWFRVEDPLEPHPYYWNVHTNQVSWRHPNDPRVEITYPAAWTEKKSEQKSKTVVDNSIPKEDRNKNKVNTGKHPSMVKASKLRERNAPYRKDKQKAGAGELDPMDPAAYSDVARGTWSSGLKEEQEVNTGVDTTANGPLFQQRPYPSPGDILRKRNKPDKEEEQEVENVARPF